MPSQAVRLPNERFTNAERRVILSKLIDAEAYLADSRALRDPEARAAAEAKWRGFYFQAMKLGDPGTSCDLWSYRFTRTDAGLIIEPIGGDR